MKAMPRIAAELRLAACTNPPLSHVAHKHTGEKNDAHHACDSCQEAEQHVSPVPGRNEVLRGEVLEQQDRKRDLEHERVEVARERLVHHPQPVQEHTHEHGQENWERSVNTEDETVHHGEIELGMGM